MTNEELAKKLIDNGHKEFAEMLLSGLLEKPKGRANKAQCCRFLPLTVPRCNMQAGTKVRMKEAYKQELIANGCAEHTAEFFDCVGIVEGPIDYGSFKGPEVDVRWQPSNFRYGYHPDNLEVV